MFFCILFGASQTAVLAMKRQHEEDFLGASRASTKFSEFNSLSSNDIKINHQQLKKSVEECYENIGKCFSPGGKWEQRGNFNFKKGVNLCAGGIQWIVQTETNMYMSEFQELIDSEGKKLISSNTSSFQWKTDILDEKDFHMLSWPTKRKDTFHTFSLMERDLILRPVSFSDLNNNFYKEIYKESFKKINFFINNTISLIKNIILKKISFNSLSKEERGTLKNLELLFIKRRFLYIPGNEKEATDYYDRNDPLQLENFLKDYEEGRLAEERINVENVGSIAPKTLLRDELNEFLTKNCKSDLAKYSYLLHTDKNEYKNFSTDDNIISNIRKYYPLDLEKEIDIYHSEPLLSWFVNKNIQLMKNNLLENFEKEKGHPDILNVLPIFFFYTERQTCPSCENIVQKMACDAYVPIIAFNEIYKPDYVFLSGNRLPFESRAFTPPYSILPQNYRFFFSILEKLKSSKQPTELNPEPFQIDYNKKIQQFYNFFEKSQELNKNKINKIEEKIESLEKNQKEYFLIVENILKENKEENLIYKAFMLNNNFQIDMISSMKEQLELEKSNNQMIKSFFNNRDNNFLEEVDTLNDFTKNFQKIPLQYKI